MDFLDPSIAPGVGTTVPGGPTYRYPVRELLGVTDAQMERVRELVLSHLSGKA